MNQVPPNMHNTVVSGMNKMEELKPAWMNENMLSYEFEIDTMHTSRWSAFLNFQATKVGV